MQFNFLKLVPNQYLNNFITLIVLLLLSSLIEIISIGLLPVFVGFLIDPNFLLKKNKFDKN